MNRTLTTALFTLCAAAAALASVPPAPATAPSKLPDGWAAGLDKEVDGIKPLCLNLWDGPAPGQVMDAKPETDNNTRIYGVSIPGVIVYLPPKEKLTASSGACVIA